MTRTGKIVPRWAKHADGSPRRLTLLGRAIALIGAELLANAACWIAAALCFRQADGLLGLALLAWTIGLRHGLDADHISAIDNATRQLVSLGQLPITCGLFFSLGHSTIVIVVNVALAISVDIYDKLDKVGSVGGIIGASVSASFLFLIACINIYFLIGAIKLRRRIKLREAQGLPPDTNDSDPTKIHGGGCLVRIIGPVLRAVDRPWKMYPVGILFGFGFDTASSIALLAISAIAQRGPDGQSISHGKIVILPFLFTAGMSLVDSLDSILMLYAYATPSTDTPVGKFALLQDHSDTKSVREDEVLVTVGEVRDRDEERELDAGGVSHGMAVLPTLAGTQGSSAAMDQLEREDQAAAEEEGYKHGSVSQPVHDDPAKPLTPPHHPSAQPTRAAHTSSTGPAVHADSDRLSNDAYADAYADAHPQTSAKAQRIMSVKTNTMSNLSIILTLLSILVALSISLITTMGLIGENCASCTEAAEDPNGGGLAGSWWRAWFRANDQSGYIGAAIVGCFAAILFGYYAVRWGLKRYRSRGERDERGVAL
ncbi:hypothetical protein IAU60_002077 [Kwoniella sp. DSM 27419]